MTEEYQPLDGNVQTTPVEDRESEEALNLDELFQDDNAEEEDVPVSREEFNRLQKGIKKMASQLGQTKKEPIKEEQPKQEDINYNPILKRLYLKESPEMETVWDEVVKETPQGQDPIAYYESKKGWQLEAKARHNAIKEDEVNRSKIDKPSNSTATTRKDFSHIKSEGDLTKLSTADKASYFKAQLAKEQQI